MKDKKKRKANERMKIQREGETEEREKKRAATYGKDIMTTTGIWYIRADCRFLDRGKKGDRFGVGRPFDQLKQMCICVCICVSLNKCKL